MAGDPRRSRLHLTKGGLAAAAAALACAACPQREPASAPKATMPRVVVVAPTPVDADGGVHKARVAPSPFFVVATFENDHPWTEAHLYLDLVATGRVLVREDIAIWEARSEGSLVPHLELTRSLPASFVVPDSPRPGHIVTLGGSWPDDLWMAVQGCPERHCFGNRVSLRGDLLRWRKGRWAPAAQPQLEWTYAAVAPWSHGRRLALAVYAPGVDGRDGPPKEPPGRVAKLAVVDGAPAGPVPELAKGWHASKLLAFPTGEIVVLGDGRLQQWKAGELQARKESLPKDCIIHTVVGARADDLWAGGSCLAHWDGTTWAVAEKPTEASIASLGVAGDGVLWAVVVETVLERSDGNNREETLGAEKNSGGAVWRRGTDGRWAPITLPDGIDDPQNVVAISATDVWLTASLPQWTLLHTTRPNASPPTLTTVESYADWEQPP